MAGFQKRRRKGCVAVDEEAKAPKMRLLERVTVFCRLQAWPVTDDVPRGGIVEAENLGAKTEITGNQEVTLMRRNKTGRDETRKLGRSMGAAGCEQTRSQVSTSAYLKKPGVPVYYMYFTDVLKERFERV
ncbi:hypothetical protein RUM44_007665 [Polyplax serrata]|uniref:Uncharacterized protein n=1 Tax=Polyplax serrata TaxID=468196 RepID=A0ABR1B722_POLSC